ncbi:MAG TPA: class D sortase [Terriglobia bacterium]|nr:class D sortase [Terriglobia bacterium]
MLMAVFQVKANQLDPRARSLSGDRWSVGEYPLKRFPVSTRDRSSGARLVAVALKPPRRSTSGARVLRWGAHFFLLMGLLTGGYCAWFYGEGRAFQAYQSWRFDQIVRHRAASLKAFVASYLAEIPIVGSKGRESTAISPPAEPLPPAAPPRAVGRENVRVPLAEGALIGRLEVPRLRLSTIVLEGDSDPVLREGLGHIPSTSLPGAPGNVAIAGHRDTFFRALKDVRKNDAIALATPDGTYRYTVQSVQVVGPDDTQVLAPSDHAGLTLVTCYPFYFVGSAPERYIVHAQQIGTPAPGGTVSRQDKPSPILASASPAPASVSEVKLTYHSRRRTDETLHHTNRRVRTHRASGEAFRQSGVAGRGGRVEDTTSDATEHSAGTARRALSWLKSLPKRVTGN